MAIVFGYMTPAAFAAFPSTFTSTVFVANVPTGSNSETLTHTDVSPNVVEVKATRTIEVQSLPANNSTVKVGTCTITFRNIGWSTSDELDCSDDDATIDRNTGPTNNARPVTSIAGRIRALNNVGSSNHGTLVLSGSGAEAIFTTSPSFVENTATSIGLSGTAVDNSVFSVNSVASVVPVKQETTITVGWTIDIGDTFTVSSAPLGTASFVAVTALASDVATGLNAAIQWHINYPTRNYTTSVLGDTITLTAKTAGTAFTTLTPTTTNFPGVAQVVEFTPDAPTDGLTYRATINGVDYDYTVIGTRTILEVVTALQPLMDANADVSCTQDGSKITCTANVPGTPFTHSATVVDITAPEIDNSALIYTVWSVSAAWAIVTFSSPIATDIDPTNPAVSCLPASGSLFLLGMTTVTCSSTDTAWNTGSENYTVDVVDTTDPVLTTPEIITLEATGASTPSTLIGATATDNVDVSPIITYDPTSLSLGETTVTVTATDAAGNDISGTTIVTVEDTTAPTLTLAGNNPYDLYINGIFVEQGFQALDIVDGDISANVTVDGEDFDTGTLGEHIITYSVTDAQGNEASVSRTVNIVNNIKPIIYKLGLSPYTAERLSSYVDAGATAVDRDGADITSSIVVSGWDYNTISVGSYDIYYDVTGAELGNLTGTNIADQAKRVVHVVDTTAPTATVAYSTTAPTNTSVIATISPSEDVTVTNNGGLMTYTFTENGSFTFEFEDGSGNSGSVVATVTNIDTVDPEIVQEGDDYSVMAISPDTITVLFDSELQNNLTHMPSISDFTVYNDVDQSGASSLWDVEYDIESVSYTSSPSLVTITLVDGLQSGDYPRLAVMPTSTSLVDLADNFFNNGNSADYPVLDKIAPTITLLWESSVSITRGDSFYWWWCYLCRCSWCELCCHCFW
jgi:hypothetical protein